MSMTAAQFREWLAEAAWLQSEDEDEDESPQIETTETFQEAGLLTHDEGVVIELEDGSEFQVTVVQSKRAVKDRGVG